ncbi:MAG TPA: hypothetical protein VN704_02740 [Verrucomicrobiae bacterium]|nr:hypothetical protein [Verrucomicrobiae bacterium]
MIKTDGSIPTDGNSGAFGYAILTSKGLNSVIVSATHHGVLDSILQHNPGDPMWHNHYLSLAPSAVCGQNNLEVKQITLESPGKYLLSVRLLYYPIFQLHLQEKMR